MLSPTDSENSFYTARDSDPMNSSLTSLPQSPNCDSVNMNGTFTTDPEESDPFTFAVPLPPQNHNHIQNTSKSDMVADKDNNVGLNIFASPPSRGSCDEDFIPATVLADTSNANDWDRLLLRGNGCSTASMPSVASRWDRDSLYQRFDPLVTKLLSPPIFPGSNHRIPHSVESTSELQERPNHSNPVEVESSELQERSNDSNHRIPYSVESSEVLEIPNDSNHRIPCSVESSEVLEVERSDDSNHGIPYSIESSEVLEVERPNDSNHRIPYSVESGELQQEKEMPSETQTELTQSLLRIDVLMTALNSAEEEKLVMKTDYEKLKRDLDDAQSATFHINSKYEQLKTVVENFRKNEDLLIQRDTAMTAKLTECDAQLEEVKESVKTKLENMFQSYERKFKAMDTEIGRLRAQLRRAEMKMEGLENEVTQKTGEIKKLSTLCDDLILQGMKQNR